MSSTSNIANNSQYNVTLYKSESGSQTIKDPDNKPTGCALKPLIGGECGKDEINTCYIYNKNQDKTISTIIYCSSHSGFDFDDTFAKLTTIARTAKPEEGFPGVGKEAM
jgi:hypothetical protein